MSIITKYYSKKEELARLQAEVDKLEESDDLKQEMAFQSELQKLMDDYSKSAKDVAKLVGGSGGTPKAGRAKRTPSKWVNPHTKEVVVTAGGNHKTLKEWREKYGADKVASWKQPA